MRLLFWETPLAKQGEWCGPRGLGSESCYNCVKPSGQRPGWQKEDPDSRGWGRKRKRVRSLLSIPTTHHQGKPLSPFRLAFVPFPCFSCCDVLSQENGTAPWSDAQHSSKNRRCLLLERKGLDKGRCCGVNDQVQGLRTTSQAPRNQPRRKECSQGPA